MEKAVFNSDGPNLRFSVPFAKVDASTRIVSGFATLDNIDSHGDIVTAAASSSAFARFRGNIREMHAPIAVGKVLGFTEEEFYDATDDKFYRGIFVSAYVSTGAEDTWQKVLDGTLTGFSIGGKVLADETGVEYKSDGSAYQVRYITDYELIELSLVDNPANQLANVFSIIKNAEGQTIMKGMAVDVRTENVLFCDNDQFIVTTNREEGDCAKCGHTMKNIGWVESEGAEKGAAVKSLVAKHRTAEMKKSGATGAPLNSAVYIPNTSTSTNGYSINVNTNGVDIEKVAEKVAELMKSKTLEGGVDTMGTEKKEEVKVETTETVEKAADNTEVTPTEEAPAVEETVDKAAEVEEVEKEEVDLSKMFSDFAAEMKDVLKSSKEETTQAVTAVKAELEETVKSLSTQVSELNEKFGALEAKADSVDKRVDSVESDTAVKKSADLGGSEDNQQDNNTSFWRGSFLGTNDLFSE